MSSASERPLPTDERLVAEALAGDTEARRILYERHVGYVSGMTRRMLRSADASEDVVQDAFILAFRKLATLRDGNAFRGWLATIAVRLVRQRIRYARLLRVLGVDVAIDDVPLAELARDDVTAEARSELAAIDAALATLPANQRIAWMLRHVEDEPLAVVVERCGCSLATAKRWIGAADACVRARVGAGNDGVAPRAAGDGGAEEVLA
jgi:RNA polymerase sigma-70 factor (ECF subfamily)